MNKNNTEDIKSYPTESEGWVLPKKYKFIAGNYPDFEEDYFNDLQDQRNKLIEETVREILKVLDDGFVVENWDRDIYCNEGRRDCMEEIKSWAKERDINLEDIKSELLKEPLQD